MLHPHAAQSRNLLKTSASPALVRSLLNGRWSESPGKAEPALKCMILQAVKKLFLWTYARNTWQYDVLCALILAFIFLTPKSWFDNGKPLTWQQHQTQTASTVLLGVSESGGSELEQSEIERRVRSLTNRPEIKVTGIRKRTNSEGKIIAYEVDIR